MGGRHASLARASWLILGLGVAGIVLRSMVIFNRFGEFNWEVAGLALKDVALVIGVFVTVRALLAIHGALVRQPGRGANELVAGGEHGRWEEQ